jgi:uncharacterized protein YbdZ (MbtH family)
MSEVLSEYCKDKKIPKGWDFTGPKTAAGNMGGVEWYLGSYAIDNFLLKDEIATFTITNTSGWRSGTRLPASWTNFIKSKTKLEITEFVTDADRYIVVKTKITQGELKR